MHLYAKIQKSAQICKCICRYAFAYNPLSSYKLKNRLGRTGKKEIPRICWRLSEQRIFST